tara:strand:+ start:12705 stop:12830 length:126 start_codon:yes stop_codon:yes gene_type:complete
MPVSELEKNADNIMSRHKKIRRVVIGVSLKMDILLVCSVVV